MKIQVIKAHHVHANGRHTGEQVILLPVIDAWYAYVRTAVPLLFFGTAPPLDGLIDALACNLDRFPFLAGHIEPYAAKDGKKRARLVWGGTNEAGCEVIEAQTETHLQSLMPPWGQENGNERSFLWDRSSASPAGLFPRAQAKSLLRVQITILGCGGGIVGFDFDHALADAHTIGLFLHSWSTIYSQKYSVLDLSRRTMSGLPQVALKPNYLHELLSNSCIDHDKMRSKAAGLPTRRPDHRVVNELQNPVYSRGTAPPSVFSLVGKTSYMLQIAASRYEQMINRVKEAVCLPVTEQAALAGILWAALNRARLSAGKNAIGLHFVLSLRGPLGLPDDQLGSPALAIMMPADTIDGGQAAQTDATKLACRITAMLDMYDQDALRAVVYDATCRDSPTDGSRAKPGGEAMTFTSGVQCDLSRLCFGNQRPGFLAPWVLPLDNFFAVMGGLSGNEDGSSKKWYRHGVTVFVRLPTEVAEALASDRVFEGFERFSEMD